MSSGAAVVACSAVESSVTVACSAVESSGVAFSASSFNRTKFETLAIARVSSRLGTALTSAGHPV